MGAGGWYTYPALRSRTLSGHMVHSQIPRSGNRSYTVRLRPRYMRLHFMKVTVRVSSGCLQRTVYRSIRLSLSAMPRILTDGHRRQSLHIRLHLQVSPQLTPQLFLRTTAFLIFWASSV